MIATPLPTSARARIMIREERGRLMYRLLSSLFNDGDI